MTDLKTEIHPHSDTAAGLKWWFSGHLLRAIRSIVAALIITAGPWLVFMFTLVVVSITMEPVLGRSGLEDLRLTVVYAFVIAPLSAGPMGVVAARVIRDSVEHGDRELVPEVFLISALLAAVVAQAFAVMVSLALGISFDGIALAFIFLTPAAAMLWICFAVMASLMAHRYLIAAFSIGMALSIGGILISAVTGPTVDSVIWWFTAGILFCVMLCQFYISQRYVETMDGFLRAARILRTQARQKWPLCVGVFLMLVGVWIDKWVLWFGPEGMTTQSGFLHFGAYDSVMFIAHLSMIPTFAMMFLFHEGELTENLQNFQKTLRRHSTHATIQKAVQQIVDNTWAELFRIVFIQLTLTVALVLIAPVLSRAFDFTFPQFLTFRVGLVTVFLYSLFYLATTILLVCGRARMFMLLQVLFVSLNLMSSIVLYLSIGWSAYSLFISSLSVSFLAIVLADREIRRFDYLMFSGENSSLHS